MAELSPFIDYETEDGIKLLDVPRDTPESEVKARIALEREQRAVRNNAIIEEKESTGLLDWGSLALALPGTVLRGAVGYAGELATYGGVLADADPVVRGEKFRKLYEETVPPIPMTEGAQRLAGTAGEAIGSLYGSAAEMAGADPDVIEAARSGSPGEAVALLTSKYTEDPYLIEGARLLTPAAEAAVGGAIGAGGTLAARGFSGAAKGLKRQPAVPPQTAPEAATMAARGGSRLRNIPAEGPRRNVIEGMEISPTLREDLDILGISAEDVPPSVAATNVRMQEILATGENVNPATLAGLKATAFGEQLLVRGQELIDKYLYTQEKTLLGQKWIDDTLVMENELHGSATSGYAKIENQVRKSDRINTPGSSQFFDDLIVDMGGTIEDLPTKVKKEYKTFGKQAPGSAEQKTLQNLIERYGPDNAITKAYQNDIKADVKSDNPTMGALELKRRQLRKAMDKDKGPYKDWDYDIQKKFYRALGEDVQNHLDNIGTLDSKTQTLADTYRESNRLYSKYKQVQESRLEVIGADFNNELVDLISGAIVKTEKGAPKKLSQLLDLVEKPDLPSRIAPGEVMDYQPHATFTEMRQAIVKNSLAQVMDKDGPLATLQALKKYPEARKVIYRELDPDTLKRMEAYERIGTVAQRSGNRKLSESEYRQHLGDGSRIIDKVSNIAPGAGYTIAGYPGAVIGRGVQAAAHVGTSMRSVNKLLDNNRFHKFLIDAINKHPSVQKSAEALENTKVYKNWVDQLDPKTNAALTASGGFAAWALSKDDEEE